MLPSSEKDRWLDHGWEHTFEEGRQWHLDGGNYHSLYWMYTVFGFLHGTKSFPKIASANKVVHDYGCAEGDGTVLLRCFFPHSRITGFDFWKGAVELAQERWTGAGIEFKLGDVTEPEEDCDMLLSIQTTDHVDDIADSINKCLKKCKVLIVSWAVLQDPLHPSVNKIWEEFVPKPTEHGHLHMPRLVPEEDRIITDTIEVYCWVNE